MLETELNDSEPNGEERSGAHSPQINTGEAQGPPPAGQAGADDAPSAKGRRRAARRPAKASGTDAAPPDATPPDAGVASPGPDAAGRSAIRFASPTAEAPDTGPGERSGVPAATFQPPQLIFQPPPQADAGDAGGRTDIPPIHPGWIG